MTTPEPRAILPIAPRKSAVDACADALREAILAGRLAPGTRLPPERALADELGVNRVTLRSALGRLAAEHLLAARQGSGHMVLDYRHLGGPELVSALMRAPADLQSILTIAEDLMMIRRALARVVVTRLWGVGRAALEPVQQAIADFVDVVRGADATEHALAAADLAVLRALLDATGRPALQLFWNPVLAIVSETPELRRAMYADPASNARGWLALEAILTAPQRARPKLDDALAQADKLLAARDALVLRHLSKRHSA